MIVYLIYSVYCIPFILSSSSVIVSCSSSCILLCPFSHSYHLVISPRVHLFRLVCSSCVVSFTSSVLFLVLFSHSSCHVIPVAIRYVFLLHYDHCSQTCDI